MVLEQVIVISREELFKIVGKYLRDAGYDARNMSETIDKDDPFKLKEIVVGLSSKDIKI